MERYLLLGFSAGGHLATSAGTHFQEVLIPNAENTSVRPDFMVFTFAPFLACIKFGKKQMRKK